MRYLLIAALLAGCAPAATPTHSPTPVPSPTSSAPDLSEGELLTRALLFDGEPLTICMPHVRDFAERVVGEPGWSTEKRLRAGAYVEWYEGSC